MASTLSLKRPWEEGVCLSDLDVRDTALSSDACMLVLRTSVSAWALTFCGAGSLIYRIGRAGPQDRCSERGNSQDFHFGELRVVEEVSPSLAWLWPRRPLHCFGVGGSVVHRGQGALLTPPAPG